VLSAREKDRNKQGGKKELNALGRNAIVRAQNSPVEAPK
jgi:hypothetical protein